MRLSKYKNVPTIVDGIRFASQAEAKRDAELKLLHLAGKIRLLQRQPRFPLFVNSVKICTYVGDWQYLEFDQTQTVAGSTMVVEDRKGVQTPAFKLKWKLAKALYPEIEWRLS